MKSLILISGLIFGAACFTLCQPKNAFGQDDKTSAKTKPPVLIRYVKPARAKTKINRRNSAIGAKNKRKKPVPARKVDLSKVPRVIRVTKQP
jgi:hypothetical protein